MMKQRPPLLDMTPEGQFRTPAQPPLAVRIGAVAILVAVLTGAVAAAALVFWFALALIPVAIIAGAVGYLALRFQLWRMRRGSAAGFRPPVYRR
jgi:hypothetical protein